MSISLAVACLLALFGLSAAKTHAGFGTAYSAPFKKDDTGFNACQFGKLEDRWEIMYGAMNHLQYEGMCGKCVRVKGTEAGASGRSYLVKIVDRCPTCAFGDVDFSTTALEKITGFNWDHKAISWTEAPCSGPEVASEQPAVEEPQKEEEAQKEEEEAQQKEEEEAQKEQEKEEEKAPVEEEEVAEEKEEEKPQESDGGAKPKGTYTDWVITCEGGRARCSNLVLASQGYQCMNREKTHCCLKPNGKDCTRVDNGDGDVAWDGERPGDRRRKQLRKMLLAQ